MKTIWTQNEIDNEKYELIESSSLLTRANNFASDYLELKTKESVLKYFGDSFFVLADINNDRIFTDENILKFAYGEVLTFNIAPENNYYISKESIKFATGYKSYIQVVRVNKNSEQDELNSNIIIKVRDEKQKVLPYDIDLVSLHKAMMIYSLCNNEIKRFSGHKESENYIAKLESIKSNINSQLRDIQLGKTKKVCLNINLNSAQILNLEDRCKFYAIVDKAVELGVLPNEDYRYSKGSLNQIAKVALNYKRYSKAKSKNPKSIIKKTLKGLKSIFNKNSRQELIEENNTLTELLESLYNLAGLEKQERFENTDNQKPELEMCL